MNGKSASGKSKSTVTIPAQPPAPVEKKTAPIVKNTQASQSKYKYQEGMDISDYTVGLIYVLISLAVLIWLISFYWKLHGSDIDSFAFWETGAKKWFEILFWALFGSIAQNTGWGAFKISKRNFQKREVLLQFARIVEAPFISLALIFILFNIGVSFGDATVSLSDVPITIVIAFTIIASFFAWRTKDALDQVAIWFIEQVKERLGVKAEDDEDDDLSEK